MGNLFVKKKASRVTEHDKAVLQIKQQRDKMKQYQTRLEKKLESERQVAKQLLINGKKERAKVLLRKKKVLEDFLKKTDGQLENLEKLIHDLEFSQVEMEVINGLKVGNDALKKMNAILNIDEIEKIMEETREGVEKQQEINELLSGMLTAEDEDAIEEEYAELIQLEKEKAKEEDENIVLPEVPKGEPEIAIRVKKEADKSKSKAKEGKIALEET